MPRANWFGFPGDDLPPNLVFGKGGFRLTRVVPTPSPAAVVEGEKA